MKRRLPGLLALALAACGGEAPSAPPQAAPATGMMGRTPVDPGLVLRRADEEEAEARAFLAQGQAGPALAAATAAGQIRWEKLGPLDPATERTVELIVAIHVHEKRFAEAEAALKMQADAIAAQGPRPELAAPLAALAELAEKQSHGAEAEALWRRVLAIREASPGPTSAATAGALVELGALANRDCRSEEAAPLASRALAIFEREGDLAGQARSLGELGRARWNAGDDAGAQGFLERSLGAEERRASVESGAVTTRALELDHLYRVEGNTAAAEALERRYQVVSRVRPGAAQPSPRCERKRGSAGNVSNAAAVVAGMAAAFRRCYNAGLQIDATSKGSVRVTARIGPGGEVDEAMARPTGSLPPSVVSCVVDVVAAATFAPPDGGGATIIIPVTFVSR